MISERLAISLFFISVMVSVLVFSQHTSDDVLLTAFLSICSIIPLIIPKRKKIYGKKSDTRVRVVRFSSISQMFVLMETCFPILKKLRLWNEGKISKNVRPSGNQHDPEKMATFSTRVSIGLIPISMGVGILGFIYIDIAFLAVMSAPVVMFFLPITQLKMETMDRKSRIEEETAYFLSYVNIMQSINMGLYKSFDAIRGKKVFVAMEKDAMEVVKRVEILGYTQNESLNVYAKTHPSKQFAEFVSGYLAKIVNIGNVPGYTEAKAKYFFEEYLAVWDRYQKNAQDIFGAILMIALILPMMISLVSVMGSAQSAGVMMFLGSAISPLIAIAMITMLNSKQPSTGNSYALSYMSFLPALVVGFSALFAGMGSPTSLALACFVMGTMNYMVTKKDAIKVAVIDRMMPEFMRDITEMTKTGMNIGQIIQVQAGRKSYKKQFNDILHGISVNLNRGMNFDRAVMNINTKSKQVKFIMFLLARTYVTGGGTSDIFHNITNFIADIEQKKNQITSSLSQMTMIVFFSPFLMIGVANLMVGMFSGMEQDVAIVDGMSGFQIGDSVLEDIGMMTVITTLSMGVVAAKISNYTVKNTLPMAITSLTTLIAIHFIPVIMDSFELF